MRTFLRILFRRLHDWLFGVDETATYTVDDLLDGYREPVLEGEIVGAEPNYLTDDLALWVRELERPVIADQMETFRRLRAALWLPSAEYKALTA